MLLIKNANFNLHIQIAESSDFFLNSPRNVGNLFTLKVPLCLCLKGGSDGFRQMFSPAIEPHHVFGSFQGKFSVTKIEMLTKLFNSNSLSTSKLELQCKGAQPFRNSFSSFTLLVKYSV